MAQQDLPQTIRDFISRHIRSVEQLEILILFARDPEITWTAQKVYDAILSTPASVGQWLHELTSAGLLEMASQSPACYRCCRDPALVVEITSLGELYRSSPVRVIEAIYKRESSAAQSFADAFKIKRHDSET